MEKCKVAKRCGGCRLQHMPYEEQLAYKQRQLVSLLGDFGTVAPLIRMDNPYHYRNKAQAAFFFDYKHRRCTSGVYQSNSRRIVPIDSCQIEDRQSDKIIATVCRLANSFKLKPYDMRYRTGFLRHVLVRRGFQTNEFMVVLVTFTPAFPSKKAFLQALLKAHPEITTVVQNINSTETNLLLTEHSRVLYGNGYIEDILCGFRFRISPTSFYQVNPVQCEILYRKALQFAGLTGKETVFDAYCGTGTIGLLAAAQAKQVIGVEINRDAVRDAVVNAGQNGVKNIQFVCDDAGAFLQALPPDNAVDVVLMDPPRAGATKKFLAAVCRCLPQTVVYISCNPVTLARDLRYLTNHGYAVRQLQGVDMFPFTKHVECVVLMTKK